MSHPIQTVSGVWVSPKSASENDIQIKDIAHALSLICRFNGHCREFYSVAQHSVIVSEILEHQRYSPEIVLAGLMHDAHEAYLGDMPSPLKKIFKDYGPISEELQKTIEKKYAIPMNENVSKLVKNADFACFHAEVRDLMPSNGWNWPPDVFKWEKSIIPCAPEKAKAMFIERFNFLRME